MFNLHETHPHDDEGSVTFTNEYRIYEQGEANLAGSLEQKDVFGRYPHRNANQHSLSA